MGLQPGHSQTGSRAALHALLSRALLIDLEVSPSGNIFKSGAVCVRKTNDSWRVVPDSQSA